MPEAISVNGNSHKSWKQGRSNTSTQSPAKNKVDFVEIPQEYSNTGQWAAPAPKSTVSDDKPEQLFTAYLREFPRLSALDSFTWLTLHDEGLVKCLRSLFPAAGTLYERQPSIDARDVYVKMDELETYARQAEDEERTAVFTLIHYLNRRFTYVSDTISTYPTGMLSWHLLWTLFRSGDELETTHDVSGEPMAIILDSWKYVQEAMGRFFVLSGHYYQWAGTTFHRMPLTRKVKEFSDLRAVSSLPTKPLTKDVRSQLMSRGKQYLARVEDCHVRYDGFFYTRAFSGASRILGIGEVVVDVKSFRRFNPALDGWTDDVTAQKSASYGMPPVSASEAVETFSPDVAFLLPPTIHGFSLRAKRWGEFLVNRLSPITWRDDSFAHLVIQPSYRRIIRSLVTVHASELKQHLLTDVVEGKGNGLIMALHGKPGTGKTLTAEAIAEHLRRPLYIVSAGELGLTVQALEKQLKDVLELAIQWNAVLLIDEADIFLEKRSLHQLERNALVGVFLRLLEYFTGVLILTTNSIESFDEAFLSRFAMCLHFSELDQAARKTLWERFIVKAGANLSDFDLDRLGSFTLNGRDIKHTIQAAQAVALVEKEALTMDHFEEVLALRRSGALIA